MRTQGHPSYRSLTLALCLLFVVSLAVLAACTAGAKQPLDSGAIMSRAALPGAPPVEEEAMAAGDTAVLDAIDDESEPDQQDDVAAAPEQQNACLNCHADKEQLITTAAPVVEVVEESEGEG